MHGFTLQNYTQGALWEIQASLKDDVLPLNQAQRKTPSFGLNSCVLGEGFGLCGKQKRPTMLTFF